MRGTPGRGSYGTPVALRAKRLQTTRQGRWHRGDWRHRGDWSQRRSRASSQGRAAAVSKLFLPRTLSLSTLVIFTFHLGCCEEKASALPSSPFYYFTIFIFRFQLTLNITLYEF